MHISKIPTSIPLGLKRQIQTLIDADDEAGLLSIDLRPEGYMIREYGSNAKKAGQLYFRKTAARPSPTPIARTNGVLERSESPANLEPKSRKVQMREAATAGETSKALEILTSEMKDRKVQIVEEEEDDDVLSQYMRRDEFNSTVESLRAQLAQYQTPKPEPKSEPMSDPMPTAMDANRELLASFGMQF